MDALKPYVEQEIIDLDTFELTPNLYLPQIEAKQEQNASEVKATATINDLVIKIDDDDLSVACLHKDETAKLSQQIMWHSSIKPYKFRTRNYQSIQIRSKQELECNNCDYKTRTKQLLRKHLKTHRKRIMCEQCKYSTRSMWDLKQHMICHSDEIRVKRYKCNLCKNRYLRKKSLMKHMKNRPCNNQKVYIVEDDLSTKT